MSADLDALVEDLAAETAAVEVLLAPLGEAGWDLPTPAPGWSVADQVSHLAYFDDACRLALAEPEAFVVERDAAMPEIDAMTERVAAEHRHLSGPELLAWWAGARAAMVTAALAVPDGTRVPWYGPPMSVASQLTARLMETWAHGQDIADALGAPPVASERLRHVVFLGWRAIPNSFAARGLPAPEAPVRVEVVSPAGERWTFGPDDAADRVSGPALDLALAVTQRRHLDDLAVVAEGPVAHQWLGIAQAFAGPPGPGRRPGQFDPVVR